MIRPSPRVQVTMRTEGGEEYHRRTSIHREVHPMKAVRLLAAVALLASLSGAAHAQTGCARLSWNTCDPWVLNQNFVSPGQYRLVESVYGLGTPNVGTDTQIQIWWHTSPYIPDAWRFDDGGCQSGRMTVSNANFSKSCPAMKGTNTQVNAYYVVDPNGRATIRLAIAYDPVAPIATGRYALWQVTFDHSLSAVGPTPADQSSCGYADACGLMSFDFVRVFTTTGQVLSLPGCDVPCFDAAWNATGYCADWPPYFQCFPVPTQAQTWGRVRATYR